MLRAALVEFLEEGLVGVSSASHGLLLLLLLLLLLSCSAA